MRRPHLGPWVATLTAFVLAAAPALAGAPPSPGAPPAPTGPPAGTPDTPPAQPGPTGPAAAPAPIPTVAPSRLGPMPPTPAGLNRADALAWEAGEHIVRGELALAESKIARAFTIDADNLEAHYQAGRVQLARGEAQRAVESASRTLAGGELHAGALFLLLRAHDQLDTLAQVQGRIRNLAARHPDHLGVQLAHAELLLLLGQHEPARRAVTQVLTQAETSVAAMKVLARIYLALGRPSTASYVLEQAIQLERDPEALTLFAQVRYGEGELRAARVLLEEATQAEPGYVEALNALGVIYVETRSFEAATDVLQRAIASAPGFAPAWLNLGSAQRGLGQFAAAEASWRRSLHIDKGMAEALYNLGILYLENPMEGRDRVQQLRDSVNAFNGYKVARTGASQDPNADKFIAEARLLIQQEEERRREELKRPPPPAEEDERPGLL